MWWHRALVITFCAAYEVVIVLARFLTGVMSDVAGRWRARAADALDQAIQRKVSPFERRYRRFVLARRFIDLKGLATVGEFTPELGEVFVDAPLIPRAPGAIQSGVLGNQPAGTRRQALGELIGRPKPAILAVVGEPGSGKTTLLRHTAMQACLLTRARRGCNRDLPILLYLRDHVAAITDDPTVSIAALLRSTLGDVAAAEPAGWLERKLRSGECLVLLDGLDEVARPEDRRTVANWTERQISQYSGNDFVITSRSHGYRTAEIAGADVVQVCGFTTAQVRAFVRDWYLAVERRSADGSGDDVAKCASSKADDLLRRLTQAPALYTLAANPLLLTMIANVHRYRGALPGTRAGLYGEICQVMLWRRQDAKNLADALRGEKKEAVLRWLAYAMMQRRVWDLSKAEVLAEIGPMLAEMAGPVSPEDFAADAASNGLFAEREGGRYGFAHQTFQEYLAASHIRDKGLVQVLADGVSDPWWREPTLLYAAGADADLIVWQCIAAATPAALALAFDLAEETELDKKLHDRLNALLALAFAPDTEAGLRRLLAAALLTRQVQQNISVAADARICVRSVSADLYSLFRQDTKTPAPDGFEIPVAEGAGGSPVTGVRGGDAVAFVRWANATANGVTYRLPSSGELNDLAATVAADYPTGPAWISSDAVRESRPVLWVPPGVPHPHRIETGSLAKAIRDGLQAVSLTRLLLLYSLFEAETLLTSLTADYRPDFERNFNFATGFDYDKATPDSAFALARSFELANAHGYDSFTEITSDEGYSRITRRRLPRNRSAAAQVRKMKREMENDRRELETITHARNSARGCVNSIKIALDQFARASVISFSLGHVPDISANLHGIGESGIRHSRPVPYFPHSNRYVEGLSLSSAFKSALRSASTADQFTAEFMSAFVANARLDPNGYTVDPDALPDKLAQGITALRERVTTTPLPEAAVLPAPQVLAIIEWLKATAGCVFSRQEPPTGHTVHAGVLASASLAGEADALGMPEAGDMFREVAAGMVLLYRRSTGDQSATEVIVLAIE